MDSLKNTKIKLSEKEEENIFIFNKLKELGVDPKNGWSTWNDCVLKDFSWYTIDEDLNLYGSTIPASSRKIITIEDLKSAVWELAKPEYRDAVSKLTGIFLDFQEIQADSYVALKLKELGVFHIWFTPVFPKPPKFKVGDWVAASDIWMNTHVFQVIKIERQMFYSESSYFFEKELRKATKEEVEAQNIKIGDYKVHINRESVVIEGRSYSRETLLKACSIFLIPEVKSLNVGCKGQYILTEETLRKIINQMDKC